MVGVAGPAPHCCCSGSARDPRSCDTNHQANNQKGNTGLTVTTPAPAPAPRNRRRLRLALPQASGASFQGDDWMEGVEWTSPVCGHPTIIRYSGSCLDCEDPAKPQMNVGEPDEEGEYSDVKPEECPEGPITNEARPFEIVMPSDCDSLSLEWDSAWHRARREEAIENTLDYALATVLQCGNPADPTDPTPSLLGNAVPLSDIAMPPSTGIGVLADAIGDLYGGSGGYLFGSEATTAALANSGMITPGSGGQFSTVVGFPYIQGPGFKPGPAPVPELIGGGPATPADVAAGESWLFIARSADWYVENPIRDLITKHEGEPIGWDDLQLRNTFRGLSEVTAIVRLDTCGLFAVKIRDCGCC